jgi:hypothetical protein
VTLSRPLPRGRRATLLVVIGLVAALTMTTVPTSLARFTGNDTTVGAFGADILSPPTALSATGGASITLGWTATPKTWAAGYTIWRSTTAGGTYSQIGSVTPRTTTTYIDSPAAGTYFYKVRAFLQNWSSVDAGPASATVGSATGTGYKDCVGTSNLAETVNAGDNNGYQTNPNRACGVADGLFARDPNSGTGGTESCGTGTTPDTRKDQHRWWGYAFGMPGAVSAINGIEVQAVLRLNNNGGTNNLCAQLSWDGGATWTTIKTQAVTGGNAWTTYAFGGPADTWGRTWSVGNLSTTNFRVRVINASTQAAKDFDLDSLRVQVTYTP